MRLTHTVFLLFFYVPLGAFFCLCFAGESKSIKGFPLEKRSMGKAGSPFFSKITGEQCGVRFLSTKRVSDQPDFLEKNPHFMTTRHARGVCAGDFDGDGWEDLFFAHPYGGHRLFRNLGGFKFADVTAKAGLESLFESHWAVGCSFVDFDGDGNLDLFVAGTGDRNLLLRNLGNGKFKDVAKELHLERTGASVQMTFADYDRDGDLDAFLVTNRLSDKPAPVDGIEVRGKVIGGRLEVEEKYREIFNLVPHPTERIRVVKAGEYDLLYRNEGDRFREIGRELGIEGADEGLAAVWFDFNRDGWIDLYVANDFYGPDRLYRNERGKGSRRSQRKCCRIFRGFPWALIKAT